MDNEKKKGEFWDEEGRPQRKRRSRSSIKSIMLFTAVAAATAVCISQLVRGIASDGEGSAMGQFAIINAMMPTMFLVLAYWFFKIFGRFMD
ncbi:MAG: hypothetical protein AAFN77_00095 [Planctomycetota bacterium]